MDAHAVVLPNGAAEAERPDGGVAKLLLAEYVMLVIADWLHNCPYPA